MELQHKYKEIYHKYLIDGTDVNKMKLWGECDKWEFKYLIEHHPQLAETFFEHRIGVLESSSWNNYLTEKEAKKILSLMSPPAKWTIDDVKETCMSMSLIYEKVPFFNLNALATTMNMLMSDHKKSLTETFHDQTQLIIFVYKQAVEKLEDADREKFLREYFENILGD